MYFQSGDLSYLQLHILQTVRTMQTIQSFNQSGQGQKKIFECKNCKKRTQSFDKLPKYSCSNCKGSSWIRTGMMREKKGPTLENEQLVIRGHEESHIGAVHSKSLNINL